MAQSVDLCQFYKTAGIGNPRKLGRKSARQRPASNFEIARRNAEQSHNMFYATVNGGGHSINKFTRCVTISL